MASGVGPTLDVVDGAARPEAVAASTASDYTHGQTNGEINGSTHQQTSSIHPPLKNASVENFRKMRVIVIGAGYSGIYMGIRIPEWLRNVDLCIYEKNQGLGGTWYENKYPGCACDIPAHSYVYTFDPNPEWSSFYAGSAEIQNYLDGIAHKYSADRFVKCGHKVSGCVWDAGTSKWKVRVEDLSTGRTIDDEADIVVSATGSLNQ